MPEGPEIWRAANRLNNALQGQKLTNVYFAFEELKEYENRLIGQIVRRVEPRGKAILTFFDSDLVMYSHNQLYGKLIFRERGEEPDTNRKLRVEFHNGSHSAYLYSASEIAILKKDRVKEHKYIRKLGPDVLHHETTMDDILSRFQMDKFINRKLTTLLLDQGFLSGIGNYLRSEILFDAGVSPTCKLRNCTDEQIKKLAEAALVLPRRSYDTKGITTDKNTLEALLRENAPRSEHRHYVYGRTGSYCHRCGTEVQEVKTGGRKVYYCSTCQK